MTARLFIITTAHCGELAIGTTPKAEERARMLGHRVLPWRTVEALAVVAKVFPSARVVEVRTP